MLGISWVAEQLLASREGFLSMEWISYFIIVGITVLSSRLLSCHYYALRDVTARAQAMPPRGHPLRCPYPATDGLCLCKWKLLPISMHGMTDMPSMHFDIDFPLSGVIYLFYALKFRFTYETMTTESRCYVAYSLNLSFIYLTRFSYNLQVL
jgi:hypothetical protein